MNQIETITCNSLRQTHTPNLKGIPSIMQKKILQNCNFKEISMSTYIEKRPNSMSTMNRQRDRQSAKPLLPISKASMGCKKIIMQRMSVFSLL